MSILNSSHLVDHLPFSSNRLRQNSLKISRKELQVERPVSDTESGVTVGKITVL